MPESYSRWFDLHLKVKYPGNRCRSRLVHFNSNRNESCLIQLTHPPNSLGNPTLSQLTLKLIPHVQLSRFVRT